MNQDNSNKHENSTPVISFNLTLEQNESQVNQEKTEKQKRSIPITLSWENINVSTASSKTCIKKLLWFEKEATSRQILNNGTVINNRFNFY